MNEFYEAAIAKLNTTNKSVLSQKANAVYDSVKETLTTFCRQNAEFAQAFVQGGKLDDALNEIMKGVGSTISDLALYSKVAAYYFPGAKVHFEMSLDLGDGGFSNEKKEISLSLDSLFDF